MFAQSVSTKSIATYQVESKLIEIKQVAAFLLIFSLFSFPDLFVLIPGCILACKWVNCAACCGCKCAPPINASRLKSVAEESRGCGPVAIIFLGIGVFADLVMLSYCFTFGMTPYMDTPWNSRSSGSSKSGANSFTLGTFGLLWLMVTALPALILAVKLHFKVNELLTYLDHSSVFTPLVGDIEANTETVTATTIPQNTAPGRNGRTPPPPPPSGYTGTYQHTPQGMQAGGMQMGEIGAQVALGRPTATA